ncbi:hypothetical protein NDU88_012030 [Pleurodeles waltl]|uniref:Uncharacterized protein n=1 Tax=Pleurodeles waltl TaxID=8319 RepID=A0AAV7QZ03_PLEWA|nr:hypothetical protein NDU88_012030 [Pleurodeles waltl]
MQQSLNRFSTACRYLSLTISTKKTEVLHQPALEKTYTEPTITVEGEILKAVDKFTYLSSTLYLIIYVHRSGDTHIAKVSCPLVLDVQQSFPSPHRTDQQQPDTLFPVNLLNMMSLVIVDNGQKP